MAESKLPDLDVFARAYVEHRALDSAALKRARRFASSDKADWWDQLDKERDQRDQKMRRAGNIKAARLLLATGQSHTIGIQSDGTVITTEYRGVYKLYGLCNSPNWSDIVAVAEGDGFLIGLRADGSVVSAGYVAWLLGIANWREITAIAAGATHVLGLRADGTVVADGKNQYNDCDVKNWKNIAAISVRGYCSIGLRTDGTVVAVGQNKTGECDISQWERIVAISAGGGHTLGLRNDGTVVATKYSGDDYCGQCEVSGWRNIAAISAGGRHSLGLRTDGTVEAVGDNTNGQCNVSEWQDLIAVFAGPASSIGIKADGTVLAVGDNSAAQLDVSGWKLFDSIDNLGKMRSEKRENAVQARQAIEQKRREEPIHVERSEDTDKARRREDLMQQMKALKLQLANCYNELAQQKGLSARKRRRELEAEISTVNNKIKEVQRALELLGK